MKYSYFKNLIQNITGLESPQIRRTFDYLIKNNQFTKKKIGKATYYRFNPYDQPYNEIKEYKVNFD